MNYYDFIVKGKIVPVLKLLVIKHHAIKKYGGKELHHPSFLTSALDGDESPASLPGHFIPWERAARIHWIGG
jgi:hypothetical protein